MSTELTVCIVCKYSQESAFDDRGRTGGELLLEAIRTAAGNRSADVKLVGQECLWACRHSCSVLVQSAGRTGYLTGRFEPNAVAAEAILDWCQAYGESDGGEVPFDRWPEGMKGHFIARIPPQNET